MEVAVLAVSVAVIVGAPIARSLGARFSFVENIFVRFLLLAAIVYAIRQGAMPGVLAFLAVYTLLLERNHEVLSKFPDEKPLWPSNNPGLPTRAPTLEAEKDVVHYDIPSSNDGLEVEGNSSKDLPAEFEKADDLHDSNPRLAEAPLADKAPEFYKSKELL
jgi:hypothetical protein